MSEHARVSPSGFKTIRLCPGSLQAQEGMPDNSSYDAKEGTFAHWARDLCLRAGLDAKALIGRVKEIDGEEFEFTTTFAKYVQKGLDFARQLCDAVAGTMYVEQRVHMQELVKDCWGTADTGIIAPSANYVIDLKFGAGILVNAEWNEQLMLYALGFYLKYRDFIQSDDWVLIIDQPRVAGEIDEWRCTTRDLLEFAKEANRIIEIAEQPGAKRIAGVEQCRFCKARPDCNEFAEYNLGLFGLDFEDLDYDSERPMLPTIKKMTSERRSYVLLNSDLFTAWLKDLHAETLSDALAGRPTPGLKPVEGRRGRRKWVDERALVAFLKARMRIDQIYEMTLKSPSQMEGTILGPKLWKKVNEFNWITQGEAKPSLVPIEDKRPALATVVDKFENLDLDPVSLI